MRQLVQKNKTPETLVDELGGGGVAKFTLVIYCSLLLFFSV